MIAGLREGKRIVEGTHAGRLELDEAEALHDADVNERAGLGEKVLDVAAGGIAREAADVKTLSVDRHD